MNPTKLAQVSIPQSSGLDANAGRSQRTKFYNFSTSNDAKGKTLYTGDGEWSEVKVKLITANPFYVSIDSGDGNQGGEIAQGEEVTFIIPRGCVLKYSCQNSSTVRITVQPIAWQEQILKALEAIQRAVSPPTGAMRR